MYRSGCWLVRRVIRESGVAVVEQSVTASRYVGCVVPCKSVEVEERPSLSSTSTLLLGPLAVRTYRTGVKALSCPKPCGRERKLCRVKAVRTRAKALSGQSRADERTGTKALSGQSRADERTGAKALSGQSRADEQTRAKALSGQSRADVRTGQKAEAKMGVILALCR